MGGVSMGRAQFDLGGVDALGVHVRPSTVGLYSPGSLHGGVVLLATVCGEAVAASMLQASPPTPPCVSASAMP